MAKLAEIVDYINTELQTTQFSAKRFQKGRWSGVAELVVTSEEETMPCIIENNGDTTKLGIDDTYSFEVYHRVLASNFENGEDDYGAARNRKEFNDMVVIVMGDRNRLNLTTEQIISGLALGFRQVISVITAARLAILLPMPGGLGTLEAAMVLVTVALGQGAAAGAGLSLLIRVRDIIFGLIGLWLGRRLAIQNDRSLE